MYAYYQVINRHETLKKLRCTIVGNRPIRNPTSPPMTQVRIYMRTNVPVKQDDDMIMMMIHWAESSLRGWEWPEWVE